MGTRGVHLPLACLVGQSRFDWYYSQGLLAPLQLRISQRHASLPLNPHNSDRSSGSERWCEIPTLLLGTLRRQPPWMLSRPRATEDCLFAGSECRSMAPDSRYQYLRLSRGLVPAQVCLYRQYQSSKHNTGRGGTARYRDRDDQDKIARNSGPGTLLLMADG